MTRSEINEAMVKFFSNGGKVTKLPDGPNFRFQSYGVRVPPSDPKVDLSALEDPSTKKQREAFEANKL